MAKLRTEFSETKEEKRLIQKNKGYIRLLKDLQKNWPSKFKGDEICNEYQCSQQDLNAMAKTGILFQEKNSDFTFYSLGIQGFQYLYIRKINGWVIAGVIIAGISALISIISFCK